MDRKHEGNPSMDLRHQAEESLQLTQREIDAMSKDDVKKLVYELQVHQIELDMQNEELRRIQGELEDSRNQYRELYDFAPVGYLTLTPHGEILQANLTAAALLGVDRQELPGQKLSRFIHPSAQDTYHLHYQAVLRTGSKQVCEVPLLQMMENKAPRCIHMESELSLIGGDKEQTQWCAALIDVSAQKEVEKKQQLLMGELNHRVKNTLTLVHSLFRQMSRHVNRDNFTAFREAYENRIIALARLHDLLHRVQWEPIELRDLLTLSTRLYQIPDGPRITLEGPQVRISPSIAQPLHMAFNELTSNAAKYGALSIPEGHLQVRWELAEEDSQQVIRFHWTESQGPPVEACDQKGFGSELLKQSVIYQLSGRLSIDYQPTGLVCEMAFPL